MAKKEKSARTIAIENLTCANKETRSISGTIKVIKAFWKSGYNTAFAYIGINDAKELTIDLLKTLHSSMYVSEGVVGKYVKVARTLNGEFVLDDKGHKIYDKKLREVTSWTPRTLFAVLEDSKLAKDNDAANAPALPCPQSASTNEVAQAS